MSDPIVMVDELRVWAHARGYWAGRPSCHLTVDGETPQHIEALHRLAKSIGLRRCRYQPKSSPHYDLTDVHRAAALRAGAVYVPARDQARARMNRRASRSR